MTNLIRLLLVVVLAGSATVAAQTQGMRENAQNSGAARDSQRPRVRDIGVRIGIFEPGPLNAITDVAGVRVGHTTIIRGEDVRTGVTAILPHGGNLFREKVPGAVVVFNAFGKLAGSTQVNELGEIETPVMLTSTLAVSRVADGVIDYMLSLPGNEEVLSINPLVGETNDGYLNDIRGRHITSADVANAIRRAQAGPVAEGTVGAGTGTIAFGWKGGIGTSSRKLPAQAAAYTVGVLVQTNFGGLLTIAGVPVYRELGDEYFRRQTNSLSSRLRSQQPSTADGSIMMVIATDAPLDHRQLRRLAERAALGLGRTGAAGSNGSGDYAIAFSTAESMRIRKDTKNTGPSLGNDAMTPLFEAVIEATEEAILNSLFRATAVAGYKGHKFEALPVDKVTEILKKHGAVQ
jgi:D-aminopeptidase